MKCLILDTTREELFAILYNDQFIDVVSYDKDNKHNKAMMTLIDDILSRNNLDIQDIDFFASNLGPGSFTGIRLGVSTVNAFHLATKKPLIGYNTFEPSGSQVQGRAVIYIDAKHSNVYASAYENKVQMYIGESTIDRVKALGTECIELSTKTLTDNEILQTVNLCINKYEKREFKAQLTPLYLKKSQAERELDERENNKS